MISERNTEIWRRRQLGQTFEVIARDHGITVERVRQICIKVEGKFEQLEAMAKGEFGGLPVQVRNCILRALDLPGGYAGVTKRDVVNLGYYHLSMTPGLGAKGMAEVLDWLGLELKAKFVRDVCPHCGGNSRH